MTEETQKKRRRILKWILIAVACMMLAAALLFVGGLCLGAYLLMSPRPLDMPSASPDSMSRLIDATEKFQRMSESLLEPKEGEFKAVEFSEAEFNAILLLWGSSSPPALFGMSGEDGGSLPERQGRTVSLQVRDGEFVLLWNKDIGVWTPFGRNLNYRARFSFRLEPGNEKLSVKEMELGRMSLPSNLARRLLSFSFTPPPGSPLDGIKARDIVRKFVCGSGGRITVEYSPYEMKRIMEMFISRGMQSQEMMDE